MSKFEKKFNEKSTNLLKNCPIFEKDIKPSCLNGDVFPAVRKGTIDFYVGGGRLLRRTAKTYQTNNGYLGRKKEEKSKDVNWLEKCNENVDFTTLKKNCEEHYKNGKGERYEVSKLIEPFSFLKKNSGLVLVDIETRFEGSKKHDADKIDLVFYITEKQSLLFVEVKDRHDSRCRKEKGKPEVVSQVADYKKQLNQDEKGNIIIQYKNANEIMRDLFGKGFNKEFEITNIIQDVPLLIIGDTKEAGTNTKDDWLEPLLKKNQKILQKDGVIVVDGREALNNKKFKNLEEILLDAVRPIK